MSKSWEQTPISNVSKKLDRGLGRVAKVRTGDHVSKGLVRSLGRVANVGAGDHIPKGLDRGLGRMTKVGVGDLHIYDIPCPVRKVSK